MPNLAIVKQKIEAVVGTERTDLAAAIRLGTAAFPETGQKRLVLMTDGNENVGDAMGAVLAAQQLGVTVDVVPMGVSRSNDVSVQKVQVPAKLKRAQAFEVKIFVQADKAQAATVRLYRKDVFLGEQKVELSAGKNLFTFPQTLADPGFYPYDVHVDAPSDPLPQNNRATGFATVRGQPEFCSFLLNRNRTNNWPRLCRLPSWKSASSASMPFPPPSPRCKVTMPSS